MNLNPRQPFEQRRLHLRLIRETGTHRAWFVCLITTGFLASLAGIGGAWLLSRAIYGIFLQARSLADIGWLLFGLLILAVTRGAFIWISEANANKLAVRIKTSLRERLFAHLLKLGPAYSHRTQTGNFTNLLSDGIEALDAYYSQYLPQIAYAILIPLAILGVVFPADPLSGLILFLTAPIIPVFMVLISNMSAALTQRQWKTLSRMSAYFLDVLQGLTTLKILGRSKDQVGIIAQVSERFRQITISVLRVTFLSALVMELTATLSTAIIAVQVGIRLLYGGIAFEQAFFVLVLVPEFYLPLRLLGLRFHSGMAGVAAARQIFDLLDAPVTSSAEVHTEGKRSEKTDLSKTSQSVSFRNVSFSYTEDQSILEDISFEIKQGQKVALVGPSGAGKSTITSLLLRFYAPDQGQILSDNADIQHIPSEDWLRNIAWVPQKPYLFSDTVAANIRLARPDASLEEIKVAARLAHADEFIQQLPNGYETQIGERGVRLSGGQAQRIAIARAFLKDSPILILDEPTSNLDPELEAQLQDSLSKLMSGRMVLVIAHRLSTVYQADRVLVLDKGKIVESGDHNELMALRGLYWRMVKGKKIASQEETSDSEIERSELAERSTPSPEILSAEGHADLPIQRVQTAVKKTQPLHQLLLLLSPFKNWIILSILLGFLAVASGIGLMSTSTYIISAAALQPSIAVLQVAIVGVRFFGISRAVFRYLERIFSHQVTFKLLAQLRVWFYRSLEPLAPARLLSVHSGDLLSRMIGDINALENFYVRGASPPLVAILIIVSVALFLFQFSSWLSWVVVIFLFVAGLALPVWLWNAGRRPGAQTIRLFSQLSNALVDGVQGMADLTAFSRLKAHFEKVQDGNRALGMLQEKLGRLNSHQNALLSLIANLALWSTLVVGAWLINKGQINPVLLGAICLAALTSFEAVQTLPQAALHLGRDLEAIQRLMVYVQAEPGQPSLAKVLTAPEVFHLEFKKVNFSYPVEPKNASSPTLRGDALIKALAQPQPEILSDISFSLSPGEHIAIVGPSGSGKTTLVNLLLRFWECQSGRILLGGHDIRLYDPEDLRKWINVVPQNTHLFSGTILENLRLANPQASSGEIERAIQQAQLSKFIQALPQGYQTWIGEQGLRLSAGERQRLALARAFLRNSPILVLDEATANLDTLVEQKILAEISRYCQQRSRLTITHRLVGLEDADEILVLQHGKVVERGRHSELLRARGIYRQMWDLQNLAG